LMKMTVHFATRLSGRIVARRASRRAFRSMGTNEVHNDPR
jgi:hypothetical protein